MIRPYSRFINHWQTGFVLNNTYCVASNSIVLLNCSYDRVVRVSISGATDSGLDIELDQTSDFKIGFS